MKNRLQDLFRHCLFYFKVDQPLVSWYKRLRSAVGALLGLLIVFVISKMLGDFAGVDEWLIASLGASAFLVFVLPGNPMAQPFTVIVDNNLSALIRITASLIVKEPLLTMPVASSLPIRSIFFALSSPAGRGSCANSCHWASIALSICPLPSYGRFSIIGNSRSNL